MTSEHIGVFLNTWQPFYGNANTYQFSNRRSLAEPCGNPPTSPVACVCRIIHTVNRPTDHLSGWASSNPFLAAEVNNSLAEPDERHRGLQIPSDQFVSE